MWPGGGIGNICLHKDFSGPLPTGAVHNKHLRLSLFCCRNVQQDQDSCRNPSCRPDHAYNGRWPLIRSSKCAHLILTHTLQEDWQPFPYFHVNWVFVPGCNSTFHALPPDQCICDTTPPQRHKVNRANVIQVPANRSQSEQACASVLAGSAKIRVKEVMKIKEAASAETSQSCSLNNFNPSYAGFSSQAFQNRLVSGM